MTDWQQLLANDPSGGEEATDDYESLFDIPTATPLTDRGVISVTGTDTNKLLQGQLTCDIDQLGVGESVPGALCEVKGRMIASLYAYRPQEDQVLLVMHQGLVPEVLSTLKKYAVFYKAELSDMSDSCFAFGLNGYTGEPKDHQFITIADNQQMLLADTDVETVWNNLRHARTPTGLPFWEYCLIRNGIGEVRPETTGEFIPQMLNLQHTGGINFRKGCYTGQEIVARMQYLGKLKRRAYRIRLQSETCPLPGTPLESGDTKNVGTVVLAQKAGHDSVELLAVLTADAASGTQIGIDDKSYALEVLSLPYDDKFATPE